MEGPSEISDKCESGKVSIASGPLVMGADEMAVAAAAARSYSFRCWMWSRILFVVEAIFSSTMYQSSLHGLGT